MGMLTSPGGVCVSGVREGESEGRVCVWDGMGQEEEEKRTGELRL